ncbi:MAG: type II secretion system F family protein [Planctomycetota bacterium]|jgi:hypothetical protein
MCSEDKKKWSEEISDELDEKISEYDPSYFWKWSRFVSVPLSYKIKSWLKRNVLYIGRTAKLRKRWLARLGWLLKNNCPLTRAMEVLRHDYSLGPFADISTNIRFDIELGEKLSSSVLLYKQVRGLNLYILNLEISSRLREGLSDLASSESLEMEKSDAIRWDIMKDDAVISGETEKTNINDREQLEDLAKQTPVVKFFNLILLTWISEHFGNKDALCMTPNFKNEIINMYPMNKAKTLELWKSNNLVHSFENLIENSTEPLTTSTLHLNIYERLFVRITTMAGLDYWINDKQNGQIHLTCGKDQYIVKVTCVKLPSSENLENHPYITLTIERISSD